MPAFSPKASARGEAAEPLPIPQGPVQSLAKDDARVLHRVVAVHMQVAAHRHLQIETAVTCKSA